MEKSQKLTSNQDFSWQKKIPVIYESQLIPSLPSEKGKRRHIVDITEPNCVAFSGLRGQGKTASLAYAGALAMAAGIPAWLNVPVRFYLIKRNGDKVLCQSQGLDMQAVMTLSDTLEMGFLGISEYQYWANAYTFSSWKNRLLGAALQQIRKQSLSFYIDVKTPKWVDTVSRFEMDLSIWCKDAYYSNEGNNLKKGDKFFWHIKDLSGNWTFTPYEFNPVIHRRQLYFKPLKGIYPHVYKVDPLEGLAGVEMDITKMKISNKGNVNDEIPPEVLKGYIEEARLVLNDREKVYSTELYDHMEITDANVKSIIRQAITKHLGYQYAPSSRQFILSHTQRVLT